MAKEGSLRELARRLGVRISSVQKARDSGRITVTKRAGKWVVDLAQAQREWRRNTLHTKRPPRKTKAKGTREAPAGDDDDGDEPLGSMSQAWHRARAVRESIQARILELDLKKRQGILLDAGDVRRAHFALSRRLRDRVQAFPRRLGPEVFGAPSAEEATKMLQEEADRICEELEPPSENGDHAGD